MSAFASLSVQINLISILERQATTIYSLKLLIIGSDRRIEIWPVSESIVETGTNLRGIRMRQLFLPSRLTLQYL